MDIRQMINPATPPPPRRELPKNQAPEDPRKPAAAAANPPGTARSDEEQQQQQQTPAREATRCLCIPCILNYLGCYIHPVSERQYYPELQGFSREDQLDIAFEWYWIAVERETDVLRYLYGTASFRDGCWWRTPPVPALMTEVGTVATMESGVEPGVERGRIVMMAGGDGGGGTRDVAGAGGLVMGEDVRQRRVD